MTVARYFTSLEAAERQAKRLKAPGYEYFVLAWHEFTI